MVFVFFGENLEMFVDLGVENWEGVGRDSREKISPGLNQSETLEIRNAYIYLKLFLQLRNFPFHRTFFPLL